MNLLCLLIGHKTSVDILDECAFINVIVKCTRCEKLLHDIDSPKRLTTRTGKFETHRRVGDSATKGGMRSNTPAAAYIRNPNPKS